MRCKQAMDILLRSGGEPGTAVEEHLDGCMECRTARDVIRGLRRVSADDRCDVSADVVQDTRRQVAAILDQGAKQPAGKRSSRALRIPVLTWRPAYAMPALLALAVGLLYVAGRYQDKGVAVEPIAVLAPGTDAGDANASLDVEIDALRYSVNYRLRRFRQRYGTDGTSTGLGVRTTKLRTRIELCSLEVRHELRGLTEGAHGTERETDGVEKPEAEDVIEHKEDTTNERTKLEESDDSCIRDGVCSIGSVCWSWAGTGT